MLSNDSLRELVRSSLARSKEPDPKIIARRLFGRLDNDQLQAAALIGLEFLTRNESVSLEPANTPVSRPGPSRRSVALHRSFMIGGEYKLLTDCTVNDLQLVAVDYRERSQTMLDKAVEAEELANELKKSGCKTYGAMLLKQERKAA